MLDKFIYEDKEEFKAKLIAPILDKSEKYQLFLSQITEQEKK
ncbi:hypothetical protein [Bernardetia sp.]|nr:hypothetical protein [Bernardetia sp.]